MRRDTPGFTIVEILIVVLILGIVAMLIVPRFSGASEEARETALITNVQALRGHTRLYLVEHAGRLPHLDENGNADTGHFVERMTDRTDMTGKLNPSGQKGPYFSEWPANPYANGAVARTIAFSNTLAPRDNSSGWHYNTATGIISPNTSKGALDTDPPPDMTIMNMEAAVSKDPIIP